MSTETMKDESTVLAGMALARRVFSKRGNHAEAHLNEGELAAIIAYAIQQSGQPELMAVVHDALFSSGGLDVVRAVKALEKAKANQ